MRDWVYLILPLLPLQLVVFAVIYLLAAIAFAEHYDLLKSEMDGWVFNFVLYIVELAPFLILGNLCVMVLLFIGFDSKKFRSSFTIRKTKSEFGSS